MKKQIVRAAARIWPQKFRRARVIILFVAGGFTCFLALTTARAWLNTPGEFPAFAAPGAAALPDRLGIMAGAIRIPTVSPQVAGEDSVISDPVALTAFRNYLRQRFPEVHRRLSREVFAEHSLLYTWQGRSPDRPPVILSGHMDVVPASDDWEAPPFAGIVHQGYLYGRGTCDDKISVIGILIAAEELLKAGFVPERTLYFAFGHDEETGARGRGALTMAAEFKKRGVRAEFVLDEGSGIVSGMVPGIRAPVALIGTGEKGAATFRLTGHGSGGHAQMPPAHTSIGRLAAAIAKIEETPEPPRLSPGLAAMFRHVGPHASPLMRYVFLNAPLFEPVLVRYLRAASDGGRAAVSTTGAVTVIRGGEKETALPVESYALINYRILPGDSVASVEARLRGLTESFGVTVARAAPALEPSPESAPDGSGFRMVAAAVHSVFPGAVPAPFTISGRTDGRYYHSVSDQILRFTPVSYSKADLARVHGQNERITPDDFNRAVNFFRVLISNL